MEHNLFKPSGLEEGKHAVVGDCNGFSMQERYEKETPVFATAISKYLNKEGNSLVLDYGCGVGRLAKPIIDMNPNVRLYGVDASAQMRNLAKSNVNNERFTPATPTQIAEQGITFDVIYCVYVLQHVPSVELREILSRIHYLLKDDGIFVYCSSDYRMAIRFDNGGFFDDSFLGVNLREEISRYFIPKEPLFSDQVLEENPVVKKMVEGDLPHPALVYTKKTIKNYFAVSLEESIEIKEVIKLDVKDAKKVLLVNRLAPGDILVMTNALRDLHRAYPGKYQTDVNTPCNAIFENNPYVTQLNYNRGEFNKINANFAKDATVNEAARTAWLNDVLVVDMQYPMIHRSGVSGRHFAEGHTEFLADMLKIYIPQTEIKPELYLSQSERDWVSPLVSKKGISNKYWVINAGSKGDFTLKQYPYFQEVVSLLKDKVTLVQIGQKEHNHKPLDGVVDMVGQTNIRELFRLIYHAQGVITCVSLPMHVSAAFNKPCVVVAGAREGTRWELYPNHQFLYVNGCLPCASYDGCWKSKFEECKNKVNDVQRCMTLITPQDVSRAVERYYQGGMLTY